MPSGWRAANVGNALRQRWRVWRSLCVRRSVRKRAALEGAIRDDGEGQGRRWTPNQDGYSLSRRQDPTGQKCVCWATSILHVKHYPSGSCSEDSPLDHAAVEEDRAVFPQHQKGNERDREHEEGAGENAIDYEDRFPGETGASSAPQKGHDWTRERAPQRCPTDPTKCRPFLRHEGCPKRGLPRRARVGLTQTADVARMEWGGAARHPNGYVLQVAIFLRRRDGSLPHDDPRSRRGPFG